MVLSPLSASKEIAGASPRPAAICLSRQFTLTFSWAPSNHLIRPFTKSHEETVSHLRYHSNSSAMPPQKSSGSSILCFHIDLYCSKLVMCASLAIGSGGGNCRCSSSRFSILSCSAIRWRPLARYIKSTQEGF